MEEVGKFTALTAAVGNDEKMVSLPVEPSHFREFISGLLGKPQTIDRLIKGPFDVSRADVENIHHLVKQRVESQNDGHLIHFSARIFYNDNSSVLINSFEDFLSYSEVKPLLSTALQLSWTWLVRFRHRDVPEKQEISISFRKRDSSEYKPLELLAEMISTSGEKSNVIVRISHTDRSWGSDLDALIDGSIRNLILTQSISRRIFRLHARKISALIAIIFGLSLISILSRISDPILQHIRDNSRISIVSRWNYKWLSQVDIVQLKLDYLVFHPSGESLPGTTMLFVFPIFGIMILSTILPTYIYSIISKDRSSHIVMTRSDIVLREAEINKEKRDFLYIISGCIGAVLLGILGNLLTSWILIMAPK